MLRRAAVAAAVMTAVLGAAPPLAAQDGEGEPFRLSVENATGVLSLEVGPLLRDGGLARALRSGLPLRLRAHVELWQDRFFDSQRGRFDWRATVLFDPLDRTYVVESSTDSVPRVVASLDEVARALDRSLRVPLRPREEGRFYYLGVLEVETLSLSDLEELQRWLRGDLAPAVQGREPVENAVEKGVRRLFVRALGLPARRFQVRTPAFQYLGGNGG